MTHLFKKARYRDEADDHGLVVLVWSSPTASHAVSRTPIPQSFEQPGRELSCAPSKTRADDARLPFTKISSALNLRLLHRPQPLRLTALTALRILKPSSPHPADRRVESDGRSPGLTSIPKSERLEASNDNCQYRHSRPGCDRQRSFTQSHRTIRPFPRQGPFPQLGVSAQSKSNRASKSLIHIGIIVLVQR